MTLHYAGITARELTASFNSIHFKMDGSDCSTAGQCILQFIYEPKGPGVHTDELQIKNSAGVVLASALVSGEGGFSSFDATHYAGNPTDGFGRGLPRSLLARLDTMNGAIAGRRVMVSGSTTNRCAAVGFQRSGNNATGAFRASRYASGFQEVASGAASEVSGLDEYFLATAVAANGNILSVGFIYDGTVSRLRLVLRAADGTLVPSWGNQGVVTLALGPTHNMAYGATFDASGKALVVGNIDNALGNYDAFVARFLPSGALDPSFSTDGYHSFGFGSGNDTASQVLLLPNGNIVVGGRGFAVTSTSQGYKIGGLELTSAGIPVGDPKLISMPERHQALQNLQWDGSQIVASIRARGDDNTFKTFVAPLPSNALTVTGAAAVTPSFTTLLDLDQVFGVAVRSNGKFLIAGQKIVGGLSKIGFIELNADGSVAATFSSFCNAQYSFTSALATGGAIQLGSQFILTVTNTGSLSSSRLTIAYPDLNAVTQSCVMVIGGI